MRHIKKSIKYRIVVIVSFLLFVLTMLGVIPLPKILVYNHTASLPVGWYLILPNSNYHVGDIVVFRAPQSIEDLAINRGWLQQGDLMMKKIGALENTEYRIDENGQFYVGTDYIGQAADEDIQGRSMPMLYGTFMVPENSFLPIAKHPNSLDGRYYGAVPVSQICYKVCPILTFN